MCMENKRSEIELQLKQIMNESGVEMDLSNPNEDLKLDSLHYISIICEIETVFDIEIPDEFLREKALSSFNDFVQLICSAKGEKYVV